MWLRSSIDQLLIEGCLLIQGCPGGQPFFWVGSLLKGWKGASRIKLSKVSIVPADLHIHTTASDGSLAPEQVVIEAAREGLSYIAISDHDSIDGVEPAMAAMYQHGITVIPGVELSTDTEDSEVHVLGYFIDFYSEKLRSKLEDLRAGRLSRARHILDKLRHYGINLDMADVMKEGHGDFVGRNHIFRAMIKAGYVDRNRTRATFEKYLGKRGLAYVEHYGITPEGAIKLILESGGVPVIAHPARNTNDATIIQLVRHGLRGIEAYYPTYDQGTTRHYLSLAKKYGLLVTGGSDFHGIYSDNPVRIGAVRVPDKIVQELEKERGQLV